MRLSTLIIASICLISVSALRTQICDGRMMKCSNTVVEEVCGIVQLGKKQVRANFQNSCLACMIGKVNFTIEGKCENFEQDAYICSPTDKQVKACTEEYNAVCGMFGSNINCIRAPCGLEYSNRCNACSSKNVEYVKQGTCASQTNY